MRWSRLALTAYLPATLLICDRPVSTHGGQADRPSQHASHSPMTPEERALRELLARYRRGDVEGASRELHAQPRGWSRKAVDAPGARGQG